MFSRRFLVGGWAPQTRDRLAVTKVRQAQAVKKHDEKKGTELLSAVEKGEMQLNVAAKKAGFGDKKAKKEKQAA